MALREGISGYSRPKTSSISLPKASMQAQMLTEMFTSVSQGQVQRLNRDKLKITILGCVVVVL